MKKGLKKALCSVLATVSLLGAGGCIDHGQKVDKNKTQLYVGLYNGGWGNDWLYKAKEGFEKMFDKYEIVITPKKDDYEYANLKNSIKNDPNDMYITSCSYYNYLQDKTLLDITDCVTSDMADVGESGASIEGKLKDRYKSFYRLSDGKYYAVPFGSSVWGLNYDVDLFEESELFVSQSDGSGKNVVWTSGKDGAAAKSAGRDGKTGTYDDGCPVTFAEFKALLSRMRQKNITPFTWSEQLGYGFNVLMSLIADAEGAEKFDVLKTLDGSFTGYDGKTYEVTRGTGYLVNYLPGKKYALDFASEIAGNPANYSSVAGTLGFTQSQDAYILSKANAASGNEEKRIAFIIEGGHWYNEAKAYINETNGTIYPEYTNGRRFSVMPFPTFDGRPGTTATYLESSHQFSMFVNAQTSKADIAKLFIKYLCTDETVRMSAAMSGIIRACDYTLSAAELAQMPYYYAELYKLQNSDSVNLVSLRMNDNFYIENQSMESLAWIWSGSFINSKGNKASLSDPFADFKAYGSKENLTPEKYMEGSVKTFEDTFKKY